MALTAKRLSTLGITVALATAYTVPGATTTRVTEICLCNTSGGTLTVRLHFIPSGGSAGVTNAIMYDFLIPAGVPFIIPFNTWLNTGDFIQHSASAVGIACTISGIESA